MANLVRHPITEAQLLAFAASNNHAVILLGPTGSGKLSLAHQLGEQLLGQSVVDHPYVRHISSLDGKAIGIEAVREIEQFLRLKVPGQARHDRLVIIENAHLLTTEAQNALLKTLEEPPAGSALILTANNAKSLLPTIVSRAQIISVKRPAQTDLEEYFHGQGYEAQKIEQTQRMSNGLPGLMQALLTDADHPMQPAIALARQLLQESQFERLARVDALSKDKELSANILTVLQQMAHISLQQASPPVAKRWQQILKASYAASEALSNSGQPKLVLTNFMLHF